MPDESLVSLSDPLGPLPMLTCAFGTAALLPESTTVTTTVAWLWEALIGGAIFVTSRANCMPSLLRVIVTETCL